MSRSRCSYVPTYLDLSARREFTSGTTTSTTAGVIQLPCRLNSRLSMHCIRCRTQFIFHSTIHGIAHFAVVVPADQVPHRPVLVRDASTSIDRA